MDTGYYIKNHSIYGPGGYTGYRIDRRRQIIGRMGYTRHWVHRDAIYSSFEGNTGYYIQNDIIYGPSAELPWDQQIRMRMARKKAKQARRAALEKKS